MTIAHASFNVYHYGAREPPGGGDMTGCINKVIIIGNLGHDPEVRTIPAGGKVCNLSVATSVRWKDRNTGEPQERTEWHRVVIFNEGIVRVAEQYLRKGAKVYIEGKLETRKWQDQSGQDRYSTEVVLRPYAGEMWLLDRRDRDGADGYGQGSNSSNDLQSSSPAPTYPDMDDEIPF